MSYLSRIVHSFRRAASGSNDRIPLAPPPVARKQSDRGSDPIQIPTDMVGRDEETEQALNALRQNGVVLISGAPRVGKTHLLLRVGQEWKKSGSAFLYTCPPQKGIGDLFERLNDFLIANLIDGFEQIHRKPESNDDDKIEAIVRILKEAPVLIALDRFEAVSSRRTYLALADRMMHVEQEGETKGRLLLCCREDQLPDRRSLTESDAHAILLGLSERDAANLASSLGLQNVDPQVFSGRRTHPFLLKLIGALATRGGSTVGLDLRDENLETRLIGLLYEGLPESARRTIDGLSVLRRPFRRKAIDMFAARKDGPALPDDGLLELLLDQVDGWLYELHPVVAEFSRDRLARSDGAESESNERAIGYYRAHVKEGGRYLAEGSCELAYHLARQSKHAEALKVLADEIRSILSFGLVWDLHSRIEELERAGLSEGPCETPEQADILQDFAVIYVRLPIGDIADHRLRSIRYCEKALRHHESEDDPFGEAACLNLRGMACSSLPVGDPARNLERAFDSYQASLKIYQALESDDGRATVHNNLGTAWLERSAIGAEKYYGRAVGHLKQAVRLFSGKVDPYTKGLVQSNLGLAYCLLAKGTEGSECFREALVSFNKKGFPLEHARTQSRLGDASRLSLPGSRIVRLNEAIGYYGTSLEISEEEVFPEDFARIQHSLAICHRQLAVYGDRTAHLEATVKCYGNALRVYTEFTFPYNHQVISGNLRRDEQEL